MADKKAKPASQPKTVVLDLTGPDGERFRQIKRYFEARIPGLELTNSQVMSAIMSEFPAVDPGAE